MKLVLSLFPGIGLLDMAFEQEGYCVVRGPDPLWGGDIKRFYPPADKFDGLIGGPPCQRFSRLAALVKHNGYELAEDLIPEFERVVNEARPYWFLMENVPQAPEPRIEKYQVISRVVNNRWCGGVQNRVRRFSFGMRCTWEPKFHVIGEALEPAEYLPTVTASGTRWQPVAIGGSGKRKKGRPICVHNKMAFRDAVRAQGLPDDFDLPGFTLREKLRVIGNGVPLPLGRAVARAVKVAIGELK